MVTAIVNSYALEISAKVAKAKPLTTLKPLESLSWNYILVLAYLAINLQISNQIQYDDVNQNSE